MNKLEKAKEIIKNNIKDAKLGLFNCRNLVGDYMETLYKDDNLQVDICYGYSYFEVFGLTDEEFEELDNYYTELKEGNHGIL